MDRINKIQLSKPITYLSKIHLAEKEYDQEKKTIFLVEDNIDMLSYLLESLNEKYNVFYGLNGREALEKIKNINHPDISAKK